MSPSPRPRVHHTLEFMHRKKYIGPYEVVPGLRIPGPSSRDKISFTIVAVCDSANPESLHGEVMFSGTAVISTLTVDSHDQPSRAAERALSAKVVELFSD